MNKGSTLGLVLLGLVSAACPGSPPPKAPPATPTPAAVEEAPVTWRESKSGLGFRLSNADPDPAPKSKLASSEVLSEADAAKVVARLPKLPPADTKAFALRSKSLPAPRPGKTIQTTFPPPQDGRAPPAVSGGELSVLRYAPTGAIEVAKNLSLTFSEAMVPITSHDDLAAAAAPVTLEPQPPGKFRWIGTQTVLFEPAGDRFPMSSRFKISVPAGTRAVSGKALPKALSFDFETPTLDIVGRYPHPWGDPTELSPLVFIKFNQRIDRTQLLASLVLEPRDPVGGTHLRLATEDEIEKDEDIRRAIQSEEPDRFIVVKPTADLPKSTRVTVRVPRGTRSAEGPRPTESDRDVTFSTHGPLNFQAVNCGWSGCPPLASWTATFTNSLDAEAFDPAQVTVKPELAGMKVSVSGRYLTIQGRSKGRTTYTVSVDPSLRDRFGQTLEGTREHSIVVGSAEPMLFAERSEMQILDPAYEPELSVFSINRPTLRVRLYAVSPEEFDRYQTFRRNWDWDGRLTAPPGRLVVNKLVQTKHVQDELTHTRFELKPYLKDGVGQLLAIVEPPNQRPPPPANERWRWREREWVRVWVQATKLGLSAFRDQRTAVGFASDLLTGKPRGDVALSVFPGSGVAKTSADGLGTLALGSQGSLLVASQGADRVFVPAGLSSHAEHEAVRWFVFSDRGLYKPKETVNMAGWVRLSSAGPRGDLVRLSSREAKAVRYEARDPRGNVIAEGQASVDQDGRFQLSFPVPDAANLGNAQVRFYLEPRGASHAHGYQIQEFRRPEFEVSATTTEGPHAVGGHAIATVNAAYYAGGGLPESEVSWTVSAEDGHFAPPGRPGYHFGKRPQFFWWSRSDEASRSARETWKSTTNGEGSHRLRVDFDALDPAYPRSLKLEASVTDVNRQSWAARTSLLVHPANVTVGLREETRMVRAGDPIVLGVLVTDLDGKAASGRTVSIKSARIERTWRGSRTVESKKDVANCTLQSTEQAEKCLLETKQGGIHRISAEVTDQHGRKSHSELDVWVLSDNPAELPPLERDRAELMTDKQEYAGGETATLLVTAPFAPAEGVLVVERDGIAQVERFTTTTRSHTLRLRLDPAWVPNVHVRVHLVGSRPRENERGEESAALPPRPAVATGSTSIKIPPKDRELSIDVKPRSRALSPGARTSVDVEVRDAGGRPAPGAAVALVVVDESVLALAGFETPDPVTVLYPARGSGVSEIEARLRIALGIPDASAFAVRAKQKAEPMNAYNGGGKRYGMAAAKPARMKASEPMAAPRPLASARSISFDEMAIKEESSAPDDKPIEVRSDLNPLAAFVPGLRTNAAGRASASVKLPDNLTRYRVYAVASHHERAFGAGESAITARLPLMVRPQTPRFLNYGDTFALPVVLQNQTTKPVSVDVVARAANAKLTGPPGLRVTVPAADRVELRFPAAAASPGTAHFQIGASSRVGSDAQSVDVPVWTPATTEAFATYGEIDGPPALQAISVPSNVVLDFGALEVTTSSTALQGLTDAVIYLAKYPFECNEQISSRILSLAALEPVLGAFQAAGLPSRAALKQSMAEDLERLAARQHYSGGWDYWRKDRPPVPFVSVHVLHALLRAKDRGYAVPKQLSDGALRFTRNVRNHMPHSYHPETRRTIEAYALYVRHRAKDADRTRARQLLNEGGGPEQRSIEALGWLLAVLSGDPTAQEDVERVRRHLDNRITETAGRAHFVTRYNDDKHVTLASDRRTDGILLEAFIDDRPDYDAIPKLARGLLGHRKRGHWGSTQDNVFVLLALHRYFEKYENITPDFVARAWLGDLLALDHPFRGRSVDRQHTEVPLGWLAKTGRKTSLTLQKDGKGRLYYRVGMQYAPADLRPPPAEHGFSVNRRYEGVDSPGDVRRDRDGSWRVKAGALVRTRVTMVAPGRRYHVALVDWLPAGFEAQNPALAATPSVPADPTPAAGGGTPWWWSRAWYEHQNLRDERAEAFASIVYGGTYEYTYVSRATIPGVFVVPPPKAEEMYEPETFGRGAGDRVIVE